MADSDDQAISDAKDQAAGDVQSQSWITQTKQEASDWLDLHFIDNWRVEIKRLWVIKGALIWIAVSSVLTIWSALVDVLPLWAYAVIGIVMNLSLGIARLLKQPGASDADA